MATRNEIQLLNLAYFGRPSDPTGLSGWESTGLTSSEIVLRFVATEEYQYNTLQPSEQGSTVDYTSLINRYYQRLFDRSAVQSEIDGWVNAVNTGQCNTEYLGITIANAGLNLTGSDLANTLNNKIAKANDFSAALAADQSAAQKYSGWLAIDVGINFNNAIGENTTEAQAAAAELIAFNRLPDPGVIIEVSESSSSVAEGQSVGIVVEGFGPDAANQRLDYAIIGNGGFGADDLVNGSLTGQITLDANGNGLIQVSVKGAEEGEPDPADPGESFTVLVSGALGTGVSSGTITVIDGPAPVPTLSVAPSSTAVDEGASISFNITSTNIAAGEEVTYTLSGVTSADVSNAPLTGTVAISGDVSDAQGAATVTFLVAADLSFEGAETAVFTATVAGVATASTSVVINDTSTPAVQSVLTIATDVVDITAPNFVVIADEVTLGQNDQITSGATGASLNIGTEGFFNIANFTSTNIESFDFTTSDSVNADGFIDMRNATGVLELNVSRSNLDSFQFEDLQSASNLVATLDDSFTDFYFNFDSTSLIGEDSFDVVFSEAPIDAVGGNSLGIVVTQGPGVRTAASVETLNLSSIGSSASNILGVLSVGSELETLNITGSVDLDITQDIGLLAGQSSDLGLVAGNTLITEIDASTLNADLFGGVGGALAYTSDVNGEVDVFGSIGDNTLVLTSSGTKGATTRFDVLTQAGNDKITTSFGADTVTTAGGNDTIVSLGGNDLVAAGNGNNSVFAFGGDNTISSLEGNDVIVSTGGKDSINSGLGNDFVIAGFGGDTIVSAGGNNTIIAGVFASGDIDDDGSADSVVTGAGNDTINVGDGADTVRSGAGNDYVIEGEVFSSNIVKNDDPNLFELGAGNDELAMQVDNLQINDVIDGGIGIDTITLSGGGVLRQSETLQTSNIEAFNLTGGGNFEVTLADELVATSDDISGLVRTFSIYTGPQTPGSVDSSGNLIEDSAGDVELDLTQISPISEGLANTPLINSIKYFGQNDANSERVIVDDKIMNQFTELRFGEISNGTIGSDSDGSTLDVLVLQDEVEITNSDLKNVDGLEVIELTATTNGDIKFVLDFSAMTIADFQRLVGDLYSGENNTTDDDLLIRATETLNVASASTLRLILPIEALANAYVSSRIFIEESAELNVFVENGSLAAGNITTALFFTPNADDLTPNGQTVVAYELSDVQAADKVVGTSKTETIDFRFGLANDALSMQEQLNNVSTTDVEVFDFNPGAVNQAVEFTKLFATPKTINGLEAVFTSGGNDRMVEIEQSLFVDSAEGNDTVASNAEQTGAAISLTVVAGSGNDSVIGGGLADSVLAGIGNDIVDGTGGNDFIGLGIGNDSALGGEGNDSIVGGAGLDTILGEEGNDTVNAGADNDSVLGGAGNDSLAGGSGNDFIDGDADNDTILGAAGNDSILSGDGVDSIVAGSEDDLIGFGDDFGVDSVRNKFEDTSKTFVTVDEKFLTAADSVDGGDGFDVVAFGLEPNLTLTSDTIQNVEQLNVTSISNTAVTLTLDNSVLDPSGNSITVIYGDADAGLSGNSTFDSTSFVQGESVVFYDTDLAGTSAKHARNFGSGDDTYANDYLDVTDGVTVAGNGGADQIAFTDDSDSPTTTQNQTVEMVRYNTGNDGGDAGAIIGGDRVFNFVGDFASVDASGNAFKVSGDKVLIGTDGDVAIKDASGNVTSAGTKATGLLFDLTQRQGSFVVPAQLYAVENEQLTLGGQTAFDAGASGGAPKSIQIGGNNMLFLTGPARSLTDLELFSAAEIADKINGVGVVGNGLEFGEDLPLAPAYKVEQQSNQALIVQQGQTNSAIWLYVESSFNFDDPLAYTAEVGELRQLGIFENALLTADDFLTTAGQSVNI